MQKWDLTSGLLVYTLLVGQVALLSTLVGKLIPTWPWRLVIFGWVLTLVHLTLLRAAATEDLVGRNPTIQLTLAFVSAELSAISIWGVLGTLRWPARLPVAVMLGSAVVWLFPWPSVGYAQPWVEALRVQVFGLLILSTLLRAAGYELCRPDDRQSVFPGSKHQFTIAHLFIWTTAIALLLGVLRIVGPSLLHPRGVWLPTFLLGGCFAIAGLAAFSAALGKGHWSRRLAVFVGMALAAGVAAQAAAEEIGSTSGSPLGLQWMIWTGLAQCFLASLLLIWNVTGYRLLRTGKPLPIAAWLRG